MIHAIGRLTNGEYEIIYGYTFNPETGASLQSTRAYEQSYVEEILNKELAPGEIRKVKSITIEVE